MCEPSVRHLIGKPLHLQDSRRWRVWEKFGESVDRGRRGKQGKKMRGGRKIEYEDREEGGDGEEDRERGRAGGREEEEKTGGG